MSVMYIHDRNRFRIVCSGTAEGAGNRTGKMIPGLHQGNRETVNNLLYIRSMFTAQEGNEFVTYNAANNQEPNDHVDGFRYLLCIFSNLAVDGNFEQELPTDRQVEHRSNADGPEKADKRRLEFVFYLIDVFVHRENDWHSTNKENQDSQKDKTVNGNDVVVRKGGPWTDSTEPHENRQVQ